MFHYVQFVSLRYGLNEQILLFKDKTWFLPWDFLLVIRNCQKLPLVLVCLNFHIHGSH